MEAKRRKPNRKSTPTKLQNGSNSDHVIMVELDTTAPISDIQRIIGDRLKTNELKNYDIYLQDIPLDPKLCLYDQAVRVSGSVELSVQVESHGVGGKLTIVEIAKNMTDEEIKALGGQYNGSEASRETSNLENENATKSESLDEGIPCDPTLWTQEQVYAWMLWIAKGYSLDPDMIKKPGMDGKKICALPIEDFFIKFPYGNIFWSHLSVLKKMTHPEMDENQDETGDEKEEEALNLVLNDKKTKYTSSGVKLKPNVTVQITNGSKEPELKSSNVQLNRSHTSNGQIQLWQFLLDLLTDANEVNVIKWVGTEGEFKFINPETVARKWGERKGKPAMNYEKLSRALRYYYDGDMISKVTGKRFQYKFVCNLKEILGYDAAELSQMVDECHKKRKAEKEVQNSSYTSIDVAGIIANGQFVAR